MASSSATSLVVFFARSSKAPAQPTQNRYSKRRGLDVLAETGTSKSTSSIQFSAVLGVHSPGVALVLQVLEQPPSSLGNSDSIITW